MNEAVVTLPRPLAPGASVSLIALYSGAIPPSAERLTRIGAPDDQALAADWDSISPSLTALRGFGNVLWLPASAPPVFLGDGARLFQSVGNSRLRNSAATIRLRLAVEYTGDPLDAAFFCGLRQPLAAISDNANLPAAESPGVATALFDSQPLGFRSPSLFVTDRPASQTGTPANPTLIAAVTNHYDALPAYAAAAALVEPLLTDWLGPNPLSTLSLLDHPGQPFEDDALLVRPMRAGGPATLAPALAHSLTHVWIHSTHPGSTRPRPVPLAALDRAHRGPRRRARRTSGRRPPPRPRRSRKTPDSTVSPAGTSLATATTDIFYRTKAAAVWWMLRSIVGDDALKQALQTYRLDPTPRPRPHRSPAHAGKVLPQRPPLVLRRLGLPRPRPSRPLHRQRHPQPAHLAHRPARRMARRRRGPQRRLRRSRGPRHRTLHSASETQRLRIPGRSSASTRIVFAGTPAEVEADDGGVPETQTSLQPASSSSPAT